MLFLFFFFFVDTLNAVEKANVMSNPELLTWTSTGALMDGFIGKVESGEKKSLDIPEDIVPFTAKNILVLFSLLCVNVPPGLNNRDYPFISIYTQNGPEQRFGKYMFVTPIPDLFYSHSENTWLPLTAERKMYVDTEQMKKFGDLCYCIPIITGYN